MKTLYNFTLVTFGLILLFSSCKKHIVQPTQSELSKLPPITDFGANTFGCLINGKAFVPGNQSLVEGPKLQCNYINTDGGYYFTVGGSNKSGNDVINDIIIFTDSLTITQGETIELNNYVKGKAAGEYVVGNIPVYNYTYFTNSFLTGQLKIIKLDFAKQIVSGTFYFNVLNQTGDTIKVTDGRFDMPYTR